MKKGGIILPVSWPTERNCMLGYDWFLWWQPKNKKKTGGIKMAHSCFIKGITTFENVFTLCGCDWLIFFFLVVIDGVCNIASVFIETPLGQTVWVSISGVLSIFLNIFSYLLLKDQVVWFSFDVHYKGNFHITWE